MATTVRKISRLAVIGRAAGGLAAFSTSGTAQTRRQLLLQTATNSYSPKSLHWLPSFNTITVTGVQNKVAGAVLYSSAATASVAREVHEKDLPVPNKNYVPNEVVLYQYEACPFCNKVKAFLDFYDIPYNIVEVNPINKKEIKWSDYRKVPILMVDGEQMVNSSDIIDKMFQRVRPDSNPGGDEVQKWHGWVDNHLVHVLSPNIYRSPSEALESFDYITGHGNFSFIERLVAKYSGAAAMYFVSKKLKKRHNITDERKALYEAAETWVDALKGRQYLGGSEPNLADLAVFGVLRPIRYLKSGKDMVENTRIGEWYTRMETEMERHRGLKLQAE